MKFLSWQMNDTLKKEEMKWTVYGGHTWARGDVGSEFAVIKCVEPAALATEQDLFHVLGRVFLFEVSLVGAGLDGLVVAVGTLVLPLTSVTHPVAPESVVIAGLKRRLETSLLPEPK